MTEAELTRLASIDVNGEVSTAVDRVGAATALASSIELAMSEAREELSQALSRRMLYQSDVADARARIAEGLAKEDTSGLAEATLLFERADREVTRLRGTLDALKLRHTEAKARLALLARKG